MERRSVEDVESTQIRLGFHEHPDQFRQGKVLSELLEGDMEVGVVLVGFGGGIELVFEQKSDDFEGDVIGLQGPV